MLNDFLFLFFMFLFVMILEAGIMSNLHLQYACVILMAFTLFAFGIAAIFIYNKNIDDFRQSVQMEETNGPTELVPDGKLSQE